jgi:hypothetical protein
LLNARWPRSQPPSRRAATHTMGRMPPTTKRSCPPPGLWLRDCAKGNAPRPDIGAATSISR